MQLDHSKVKHPALMCHSETAIAFEESHAMSPKQPTHKIDLIDESNAGLPQQASLIDKPQMIWTKCHIMPWREPQDNGRRQAHAA
jgi:hypothetical protein